MKKNNLFSETQGDLFDYVKANFHKNLFIPHVTNNCNAWGAGFVVPLGKLYPEAKKRYHDNEEFRVLGKTQFIPCLNHVNNKNIAAERRVIVANMCAQTLGGKRPLFYNELSKCMDEVYHTIMNCWEIDSSVEIVCPRFGSALAGGNWEFIKELIHDCWVRNGITVKVFYL